MRIKNGSVALLVLAALLTAGCDDKPSDLVVEPGKPRLARPSVMPLVGIALASLDHSADLATKQGIMDELKVQGLEGEFANAENSAATQRKQVENLIHKGAKAILLVPVDPAQAVTVVQFANKYAIPILCLKQHVTAYNARVTATVSADNEQMGEEAARYARQLLCERYKLNPLDPDEIARLKTSIAHFRGEKTDRLAQERAQGFEKTFNPSLTPGVKIITVVGDNDVKSSQEAIMPILASHPDIELVFCHNDETAIGALQAIQERKNSSHNAGDTRHIFIVSIDGSKQILEEIRKGEIDGTDLDEPIEMGKAAVKQVRKILDGGKPDSEIISIRHHLVSRKELVNTQEPLWTDQIRITQ